MPHVNFNPDSIDWSNFFTDQQQIGGAYFRGVPYMRGAGVGALFRNLFRYLLPITKSVGREVGREGLAVGARVLGDIAKGEDAKQALTTHSREGISNLLSKASDKLRRQSGSGRRRRRRAGRRKPLLMLGQGRRRRRRKQKGGGTRVHTYRVTRPKRRKRRRATHSTSSLVEGRSLSKQRRVDSLGLL